jgi:flagellar biosynthesis component FlhA
MILLDEIPEESGRVELDKRFCPASAEALKSYGLDVSNCVAALNPLTGETGYWMSPSNWDSVIAHGGELWDESLYLVNHLEAVLRQHLAKFVGLYELEYDILPVWRTKLTDRVLIDRLLPDQATKLRLVWLLRELAAERVPLVDGPAILEAVNQMGLTDVEQILRAVRLCLKASLPGNRPEAVSHELPIEWEHRLFTHDQNDRTVVTVNHVDVHSFLQQLQDWTAIDGLKLVLVTSQAAYRRPLRHLISGQFPDVMVMSQEECLPRLL